MSGNRPFGVSLIGFWLILAGLINVAVGVMLLIHKGESVILQNLDVAKSDLNIVAITALVFGVIIVALALALRSGSNFARFFLAVVWVAQVAFLVYAMVKLHALHWTNALWPAAMTGLAALYLLFDKDARQFFGGARS